MDIAQEERMDVCDNAVLVSSLVTHFVERLSHQIQLGYKRVRIATQFDRNILSEFIDDPDVRQQVIHQLSCLNLDVEWNARSEIITIETFR